MTWCYRSSLCNLKRTPDTGSETVSQGLYGESLSVIETVGAWCRVRNRRDGYEGFVPGDSIVTAAARPTHQVCVRGTLLFEAADIKSPVVAGLSYSSELVLTGAGDERFRETHGGHFVWAAHCLPLHQATMSSPVEAAVALFSGTPYLWGGRSPQGCDCSALVQLAAHACGISLPRDSGDQEAALSQKVDPSQCRPDDLMFWPGHVALVLAPGVLWHATAHSLSVCREPLDDVIARAGAPSSVRRLPAARRDSVSS